MSIRVLMVSKACLVGTYQTKLEALAREAGIELAVVVPPSWNDPAGRIELEMGFNEGYELWIDPIWFNGRYHFYLFPSLKRRLKEFRPDIVHIDEEPYNLASFLAMRQARQAGARALFFSWQNIYREYPFPFRQMEARVLAQADYALMGNQAAVEVFHQKGYSGPHAVIPQFGVSPDLFAPPLERETGDGINIGFAGRLIHGKGLDLLLQAAARLVDLPDWRLVLAGNGPERHRLEALVGELDLTGRVRLIGGIQSREMPTFLGTLDILVLPSRTLPTWKEQFGRVLIEAMACEVAVIGSNSGEIPHVIGDAGLIFPEENISALADQLRALIVNEERRRTLAAAGRRRVLDHFTQARIAAQTAAVYRQMMEK